MLPHKTQASSSPQFQTHLAPYTIVWVTPMRPGAISFDLDSIRILDRLRPVWSTNAVKDGCIVWTRRRDDGILCYLGIPSRLLRAW